VYYNIFPAVEHSAYSERNSILYLGKFDKKCIAPQVQNNGLVILNSVVPEKKKRIFLMKVQTLKLNK
jgi:hypothetical protein